MKGGPNHFQGWLHKAGVEGTASGQLPPQLSEDGSGDSGLGGP